MKRLLFILTLAFATPLCFAQDSDLDSMNCDTVVKKFLGTMSLDSLRKTGQSEEILYLLKKDDSYKMSVHLSIERVQVYCYVCDRRQPLTFLYVGGHYWAYYEKIFETSLEETIKVFLRVRGY